MTAATITVVQILRAAVVITEPRLAALHKHLPIAHITNAVPLQSTPIILIMIVAAIMIMIAVANTIMVTTVPSVRAPLVARPRLAVAQG
jgi:hypothetical protein